MLTYHSVSLLMDPTQETFVVVNLEFRKLKMASFKSESELNNHKELKMLIKKLFCFPLDSTCLSGHAGDCLGIGE